MSRKIYNKLVRDCIPNIIRQNGRDCCVETMSDEDYRKALFEKLIEEAKEAASANPEEIVTELVDLYEVIDSVMELYGITREILIERQLQKRNKTGGFS
jgi:predicted house-cleaning noncanonical NTP pyrophosphatase (MazG superfamily)